MVRYGVWLAGLWLALSAGCAAAQEAEPDRDPEAQHVGPVSGALAGVVVESRAGSSVRRGTGVFVRCDGFLLIPSSLFLASDGKTLDAMNRSVTVWLEPGTDRARAIRLDRVRPAFARNVPYCVIRVDGVHLPAASLLLPDTLRDGDGVRVVGCAWDTGSGSFGKPFEREAKIQARPEGGQPASIRVSFAEPLDGVASGSVVVGPEGKAVGMVCSVDADGRAAAFATFDAFNLVTNCVTPVPTPDADFHGAAGMVRVKGARVLVPTAVLREQPDMAGVRVACVHSFLIDKREVTNAEYYEFWKAVTGQAIRAPGTHNELYPVGWEVTGTPFAPEAADLPVLGVPLEGAAAYARWVGKRLPTPFEWTLAALGPQGEVAPPEWVVEYARERRRLWAQVCDAHAAFLRERPDLWSDVLFVDSRFAIPWIVLTSDLRGVSEWSKGIVDAAVDRFSSEWLEPQTVLPGGSRRYDRTPEGAEDMLMNAWEIVMPPRPFPAQRPSYYLSARWLPAPPPPNDPWRLLNLGPLAGVDQLPPLSRLIRRLVRGPSDQDLLLISSLSRVLRLLAPVGGLSVGVGWDLQVGASARAPGRFGSGFGMRPAGLGAWVEFPHGYHAELGRQVPLHTVLPSLASGATLHYCLPVGFRCVR